MTTGNVRTVWQEAAGVYVIKVGKEFPALKVRHKHTVKLYPHLNIFTNLLSPEMFVSQRLRTMPVEMCVTKTPSKFPVVLHKFLMYHT